MESILQECGPVLVWKRNKNEKGKPVGFGTVEFLDVKGIIRTMKILNNKIFKGKRLYIKMGTKPKKLIGKLFKK
jgi:RNA recognition motif-containing protein